MALLSDALTFARAQAQTDSSSLTNANGIIFANEALVDLHRRLVDKGVDASQLQEAFMSATVGQGTYTYPTDMLWLKAIELNYSGNQNGYVKAEQVDVSNITQSWKSFTDLRINGNAMYPQFDDRGDWFEVFPTPIAANSVTNMIRIFYFLKPTEYSSVSDTIAYPESQDYRILGYRIAANFYQSLNKFEEAEFFNAKYDERVRQYISTLGRGSQQPIQATPITWSGWEF